MKEFKYEWLVRRTRELIEEYKKVDELELTIRQIYYRLVVNKEIDNNRSQYVYFDKVLTQARQKDLILADYFVDDTRTTYHNIGINYPYWQFTELIDIKLDKVKTCFPEFDYNECLLQDKIPIILLEKRTLRRIFEKALEGYPFILPVGGGFNSFTQMYWLRELIKNDNREMNLYCFGDFDDSGLLIQNTFLNQMRKYLKIHFNNVTRVALTKNQIEKYQLPTNPSKKSTHSKYNLPYFVELDAFEPKMLKDLVSECINENFDFDLWKSVQKALDIRNRRLKTKYFKELKKIDLSKI